MNLLWGYAMPIRYLLPLAAVAGVAVFGGAPVAAQPGHPPSPPALTVSAAAVVGCGNVVLEGNGYTPNELVEITTVTAPVAASPSAAQAAEGRSPAPRPVVHATAAQEQNVRADSKGAFSLILGVSEVGRVSMTATGTESGLSSVAVVTVVPPACGGMPATDGLHGRLLTIGAVTVGGALAVVAGTVLWRRRHQAAR